MVDVGKTRLRYRLEFDLEVDLGDHPDTPVVDRIYEVAEFEEGEFARYPERYLGKLPDNAKFTVEP